MIIQAVIKSARGSVFGFVVDGAPDRDRDYPYRPTAVLNLCFIHLFDFFSLTFPHSQTSCVLILFSILLQLKQEMSKQFLDDLISAPQCLQGKMYLFRYLIETS